MTTTDMPFHRALHVLLLLVLVTMLAGCSDGGDDGDGGGGAQGDQQDGPAATVQEDALEEGDVDPTRLQLEAVGDSGVRGTVGLEPGSGSSIDIDVRLDGDIEPTHGIEARVGSCADATSGDVTDEVLGDAASFTMADIEDGAMQDTARIPDEVVSEGTYALVVYADEDVDGDVAACVEVEVR